MIKRNYCRVSRGARHREAGQALPLVLVAVLLAALVAAGAVRLGVAASHRAGAQAAADAAALAGAAEGRDSASRVAGTNRARLVSYREEEFYVVVSVVRDGVQAQARARWLIT